MLGDILDNWFHLPDAELSHDRPPTRAMNLPNNWDLRLCSYLLKVSLILKFLVLLNRRYNAAESFILSDASNLNVNCRFSHCWDGLVQIIFGKIKHLITFWIYGTGKPSSSSWKHFRVSSSFTRPSNRPEISDLQLAAISNFFGNARSRGRYHLCYWWLDSDNPNAIRRLLRRTWSELE